MNFLRVKTPRPTAEDFCLFGLRQLAKMEKQMAAIILGYITDPIFVAFHAYLFNQASGCDWRVEWSSNHVDMHGHGTMRFGQIRMKERAEGISIGILSRFSHALEAAQKSDKRRFTILFASATPDQLARLTAEGCATEAGYAIIKNGRVPLLGEYPNAVLVWGDRWTGKNKTGLVAALFDEIIRTYIFPEEIKPAPVDRSFRAVPGPDELAGHEGCG